MATPDGTSDLYRWLNAEIDRLRGTHSELTAFRALARRAWDGGDPAAIIAELAALASDDDPKPWIPR